MLPSSLSSFSPSDFMAYDKNGTASTILDLGAVDENQLFQLSEAEWGQVLGDYNGREFNGNVAATGNGIGGTQGLQWDGGVRGAFGL